MEYPMKNHHPCYHGHLIYGSIQQDTCGWGRRVPTPTEPDLIHLSLETLFLWVACLLSITTDIFRICWKTQVIL
jgi:hypothetical protein